MKQVMFALFVCLLTAILPTPAHAACGANGDVFELTLTEEVVWGLCDPYRLDFNPETFEYAFPLGSAGSTCTAQVEPNACEINDSMTCEIDPINGADAWITVAYYDVQLINNGTGIITFTVEDEWSWIPCYLEYSVTVEQISG